MNALFKAARAIMLCLGTGCLLAGFDARAAELVTATITITNSPAGLPTNITVNGSTRYWTNDISASPGTLVLRTNNTQNATTNLLNHFTSYPVDVGWILAQSNPTNITMRARVGQSIAVSFVGNWATVSYATQTVSSPTWIVRVPITVEAATNRTNIASLVVDALQHSTNGIGTNWAAGGNYLTKGASTQQVVIAPVQFNAALRASPVAFTNGFTSAVTNINPVTSNLVNYGNAIRSQGNGGNSFQIGSNAQALGALSMAVGNNATATNDNAIAIGVGAKATNTSAVAIGTSAKADGQYAVAFGNSAIANTNQATAIGDSSTASGLYSVALGYSAIADSYGAIAIGADDVGAYAFDAIAIGFNANADAVGAVAIGPATGSTYSNSVALGTFDHAGNATASTTTNQIRLGTANHFISAPGVYDGPVTTNATLRGTNVVNGRVDFYPRANTGLANGNNAGIVLGTNVYIRLSGATTAANIAGFSAEQPGSFHIIQISGALTNTVLNDSGVDPTAANRIVTGTGGNIELTNNPAFIQVIYDDASSRWRLINWTR